MNQTVCLFTGEVIVWWYKPVHKKNTGRGRSTRLMKSSQLAKEISRFVTGKRLVGVRKSFPMSLNKRVTAEFIGTLWLVFGGCGSAVMAAAFPQVGIGLLGVSLAFGLTVLTMAYAIGHISGCHLNPAVSVGLAAARRFPASEIPAYVVAQVLGGIAGSGLLYVIASGTATFSLNGGFAANGYASPLAGRLHAGCRVHRGVCTHLYVSHDHPWRNGPARARWLCPDCHWSWANADTSDRDTGHRIFR